MPPCTWIDVSQTVVPNAHSRSSRPGPLRWLRRREARRRPMRHGAARSPTPRSGPGPRRGGGRPPGRTRSSRRTAHAPWRTRWPDQRAAGGAHQVGRRRGERQRVPPGGVLLRDLGELGWRFGHSRKTSRQIDGRRLSPPPTAPGRPALRGRRRARGRETARRRVRGRTPLRRWRPQRRTLRRSAATATGRGDRLLQSCDATVVIQLGDRSRAQDRRPVWPRPRAVVVVRPSDGRP